MDFKVRFEELKRLDEERHYRAPQLGDPIYERELACISIARGATLIAGGTLHPAFAPTPSFLTRLFGRTPASHSIYPVPRVKTVFWLWQKYRPNPWGVTDNEVIEAWLQTLYGGSISIDVATLVAEGRAGDEAAYAAARKNRVHIIRQERWNQVTQMISEALPPYG